MLTIARNLTLVLAGFACVAITSEAQAQQVPRFGFNSTFIRGQGERVNRVDYNSIACCMGLQPGDMITAVNGGQLYSSFDWNERIRSGMNYQGGRITLSVMRYGQNIYLTTNLYNPGFQQGPGIQRNRGTQHNNNGTQHSQQGNTLQRN